MEISVVVLCVLVQLLFKDSTFAADLTLYTDEINLFSTWPRLIYDNSSTNLCEGELKFQFKTFLKDALVLYQDDNGEKDSLAITLQDGHLRVEVLFGWDFHADYKTAETYNDFKWHVLGVRLNCPETCLEVTIDDQKYRTERPKGCGLKTDVQIGGFSSNRKTTSVSNYAFGEYFIPNRR